MNVWISYLVLAFFLLGCGNETSKTEILSQDTGSEENPLSAQQESVIPFFTFDELENKYLNQSSEEVLVLNFWATWCKPCVKELPAFEQLGAEFKDRGVEVVLVSLDFPEHVEKAVVPFIEKNGLKNEVVLLDDPDANTWIPKVSSTWSGAIPATLIIKKGQRYFYEQSFTYESLKNEVQPLLNK